jgi:hypothetical protein
MYRKKRVSFRANGKRVSFLARVPAKGKAPIRRRPHRVTSRRSSRIQRDTERFVEAGLAYVYPAAPVIIAGARLAKDLLDE